MPRKLPNDIENHWLTEQAARQAYSRPSLEDVLNPSFPPVQRMVMMEQILLRRWRQSFRGRRWQAYFDSSLIAHADAALSLSRQYAAVMGIGRAAIAYMEIFRWFSFPVFYDRREGNSSYPVLSEDDLEELRQRKMVLLVSADLNLRTGKMLADVARSLRDQQVKVGGAYIGRRCWPGEYSANLSICGKRCGSTWQIFRQFSHRFNSQPIPPGLRLYTSVLTMPDDNARRLTSVLRVARYLRERERGHRK